MNARTVTGAALDPATFHLDCIDHLCSLECLLCEVHSAAGEGPNVAKLNAVRNIMASVSEFAESRFSAPAFNNLARRIHKLYERTKSLEEMFNDASWGSLKRLLGKRPNSNSDAKRFRSYEQLHKDFNLFLVEYFFSCVKRFDIAAEEKQEFLESVDAFIDEVDRVWN